MIKRHKDELEVMKNRLKEIDFYLEEEGDYIGTFGNGTNWKIIFETEPYYEGYNIWITKIVGKDSKISRIGFSIIFLMKIFGLNPNVPIENDLNFLIEYKDKIFDETFPYREAYDKLNR